MQFPTPSKCCASDFLSLKLQNLFGFCLPSANQWKKCAMFLLELGGKGGYWWLLLADWTGARSTCSVQGSKGDHVSYIKNLVWSAAKERTAQPPNCSICLYKIAVPLWTQSRGKREHGTQRNISDVKCLFQGHLWGRNLRACYSLAQACFQNHSSAPNTCGILLKIMGASL